MENKTVEQKVVDSKLLNNLRKHRVVNYAAMCVGRNIGMAATAKQLGVSNKTIVTSAAVATVLDVGYCVVDVFKDCPKEAKAMEESGEEVPDIDAVDVASHGIAAMITGSAIVGVSYIIRKLINRGESNVQ